MLHRLLKPWFIWRPRQILVRMARAWTPTPSGYRPLRTAWGATVVADPTKAIGHCIWTTGIFDLSVSETLARLVRPGDLVIDAGANVGYMSLLAAAAAGPTGRVLSFEPNRELLQVLSKNLGGAGKDYAPIERFDSALGSAIGTAELILPSEMSNNDGLARIGQPSTASDRRQEVPITTLDSVVQQREVGVLKLDVEGFELHVLQGASRCLSEGRIRDIVFEDHKGAQSEVCLFLRQQGYKLFSISWRVLRLSLQPAEQGESTSAYEAQSFLATRSPQDALARCGSPGWRVLRTI
ncbi:MAG: hypothetical protein C0483_17610 [Pirellula sp.]|nr:hypothetical protein [Pirellula sp.]